MHLLIRGATHEGGSSTVACRQPLTGRKVLVTKWASNRTPRHNKQVVVAPKGHRALERSYSLLAKASTSAGLVGVVYTTTGSLAGIHNTVELVSNLSFTTLHFKLIFYYVTVQIYLLPFQTLAVPRLHRDI